MLEDLDGLTMFVAVAEAKGFRAAGARLGVSGSAVNQAIRRLEERLGIGLVRRTTRSVHLTDAGQKLYAEARPALEELRVEEFSTPFPGLYLYYPQRREASRALGAFIDYLRDAKQG